MSQPAFMYKYSSDVIHRSQYFVVWCTPRVKGYLVPDVADRLGAVMRTVASRYNATILDLEIRPEQVRMRVEVAPQVGIHRLIQQMKDRSATVLPKEFPDLPLPRPDPFWTSSYFVATLGAIPPSLANKIAKRPPVIADTGKRLKHIQTSVFRSQYLVGWGTKTSNACLTPDVAKHLKVILKEVAQESKGALLDIKFLPDQLQMLIDVSPQVGLNLLLKRMRTASIKRLNAAFDGIPLPLWTPGYFLVTVGDAPPPELVDQYVLEQAYKGRA